MISEFINYMRENLNPQDDKAIFDDCKLIKVTANSTSFRNTEFAYCDLNDSEFEECNFSYSKFIDTVSPNVMRGCCVEKADLAGIDDRSELLEDCSEKEWAAQISGMNIVMN